MGKTPEQQRSRICRVLEQLCGEASPLLLTAGVLAAKRLVDLLIMEGSREVVCLSSWLQTSPTYPRKVIILVFHGFTWATTIPLNVIHIMSPQGP